MSAPDADTLEAIETVTPTVVIDPGEVTIGAVMLKDGVGSALATVKKFGPGWKLSKR